jgi:transposase-like protein
MNTKPSAHSAPIPSTEPRARRHRSADERRQWVGMYERSGQTLKEFCLENGLALSTLLLWRRQLRKAGPSGSSARLVEVALSRPVTESAAVSVHLPHGVRLEISSDTDALWLAKCLRALCWAD